MNLVVFDIDGTLTETFRFDVEMYTLAVGEELDLPNIAETWTACAQVTDTGICRELFRRRHGREVEPARMQAAKERFVEMLRRGAEADPSRITSVPGASEIVEMLCTHESWRPALATGGWRPSALLKLAHAGFNVDGLPLATSDECESRVDIVGEAIRRARATWNVAEFERVVCVGDGAWDVTAARELGFGFIGVQRDGSTLPDHFACILHDYTQPAEFMRLLETCPVPSS